MKRWHEDYPRTCREWRKRYLYHVKSNIESSREANPYEGFELEKGRFRKRDAWDCGNVRCGICHSDKFPVRELTRPEILSDFRFKESLEDLGL